LWENGFVTAGIKSESTGRVAPGGVHVSVDTGDGDCTGYIAFKDADIAWVIVGFSIIIGLLLALLVWRCVLIRRGEVASWDRDFFVEPEPDEDQSDKIPRL
jgi:hypothetical protein